MLRKKPLVSVVMPVYNAGSFLVEAVESILSQTLRDFELIIVNDASTDDSLSVILSFAKRYPKRIKVVNLTKNVNMGGDAAGNIGFALAKGKFIARMDADDIAMPERLEKQVEFLKSHPEISVVGSSAFVINKEGSVIGEKKMPCSNEDIYNQFFTFHPMIHPTVMVRRTVSIGKSLYNLKYQANNDYLTFFSMISSGVKFANLPEKLLFYRFHGKNDSLTRVKSRFLNSLKIRFEAIKDFGYKPGLFSIIKLLAQSMVVFLLPEKVIVPVYLVVRGIIKPKDLLPKFKFFVHPKQLSFDFLER